MTLTAGTFLGPYKIQTPLGKGGQGEVYKAWDTRLERWVAVKVLPAHLSSNPELKQRFEREARAVAALDHPHIVKIHDICHYDGVDFLVMAYLEGETVAARLEKGPMPLDQALQVGIEIADALNAAHRHGITHRDCKCQNIMLTKDGSKLLDFGLAKLKERAAPATPLSQLPTGEGAGLTADGTILGTLQYMAPEQLEGKEADARTDIFAFGAVMYEMVTGRKAFEGKSQASLIGAIMHADPPLISELKPMTPHALDRVVKTCLAKDPDERQQTARDLLRELRWISEGDGHAIVVTQSQPTRLWWALALVGVALVVAIVGWLRRDSGGTVALPSLTFTTIVPPSNTMLRPVGGLTSAPEISPDGSTLMYSASDRLYVRRLDSLEATSVPGSERATNAAFWSADSKAVVYPTVSGLVKVRVPDGAPEVIPFSFPTRGGSWSDGGTILIGGELSRVAAAGGETKPLEVPGFKPRIFYYPEFLPGGEDFIFFLQSDGQVGEVYLAALREGKVSNPVLLLKNDTAACYTPAGGGNILFVRNDNLYLQKLDLRQRTLQGEPQLIQKGVGSGPGLYVNRADFSVSRAGAIAWRPGRAAISQVTIFDRQGSIIGTTGPPSPVASIVLSPDEKRLLALGDRTWLLDVGQPGALSLAAGWVWNFWSPDGTRLIGGHAEAGLPRLGELAVDGSGSIRELGPAASRIFPQDLSPDGKQVLYMGLDNSIVAARLDGTVEERAPKTLVKAREEDLFGQGFSPDGRWIVYTARGPERQTGGIYVQPFPGPGLRRQIAGSPGIAQWRKDGKEIVYLSRGGQGQVDGGVYSVRVDTVGNELRFGVPELLFSRLRIPAGFNTAMRPLAVSRDGSRFYFPQAVEQPDSNVIHIKIDGVR